MVKRGLGKGLDALIPSFGTENNDSVVSDQSLETSVAQIPVLDIDPNLSQPRKQFDDEKIMELAQSIKNHGVVQPIIVKPLNGRYIIIAGERRWRAAKLAGLENIPVIIKNFTDREILSISLVENLQREDLNPIEEANGIKILMDEFSLTQDQVADEIGKSRPSVTNILRLLKLPDAIQKYIIDGSLTYGHARALITIPDDKIKLQVAKKIIENKLTVRETEKLIKSLNDSIKPNRKAKEKPNFIADIESNLQECLGTKVNITPGKNKGVIEIEYYNNDDLDRIISMIVE